MGKMVKLGAGKQAAVDAAGGVSALARKIKVTSGAVSQWRKIPAERVIEVERVTGVSRAVLRPDLYAVRA
jgi:DNA-binding transcriptional regulator YdaS (Cro superfamily)